MGFELKPHQKEAVERIKKTYQLILADEMGLGKTATILKATRDTWVGYAGKKKILVVCPASLKKNWQKEIVEWSGWPFKQELDKIQCGPHIITNYERLKNFVEPAEKGLIGTVIFDEAHYLKNPKSQRFYYAERIAARAEKKFLLTGTPMVSGPCDLAPLLDILGVLPLFGGYEGFYKRYCDPSFNGYGWDYTGASNKEELKRKLKPYIIRRTKKEVGIGLPKKSIVDVPMIECKQPYADSLQEIEAQFRTVNRVKYAPAVKFINDLLEKGERPVVFLHHRSLMARLKETFKDSVQIYGGQSVEDRNDAVEKFQKGEVPVILCSLQASATGLTLTSSRVAVFMEYLWSPSVSKQAQDRVHRISQTRDVTIYNLYCPKSIEEQQGMRSFIKELDMRGVL